MEDTHDAIREMKVLGAEGFIRFSIKADDTASNQQIHDAFREFCKVECGNDYTLGLKTLLEYYQTDAKFVSLYDQINDLRVEVEALKDKVAARDKKEAKDESNAF